MLNGKQCAHRWISCVDIYTRTYANAGRVAMCGNLIMIFLVEYAAKICVCVCVSYASVIMFMV